MNPTDADHVTLSPDALREWEWHTEQVLRGVGHALNNRAASVSAVLDLSLEPDGGGAPTRALLAAEVQRLRDLADVVRTVGSPRGEVEAFAPSDAAVAARVVLSLHADLRDRVIAIAAEGAPPVRARKWLFVRALVALAHGFATRHSGEPIMLELREDGEQLRVVALEPDAPAATADPLPGAYVREAVQAMGGELLAGMAGFTLPSLAELRRRERR